MNPRIRSNVKTLAIACSLALGVAAVPVVALHAQNDRAAVAQPAPPVTGLPDFTGLVKTVGPGVVNIEAKIKPKRAKTARQAPDMGDMPEFFRRFFGEGMPMPGMPDGDQAGMAGTAIGSGFIISANGDILTNHHVVDGADSVTVKLPDGRSFPAQVKGSDAQSDVALLHIDASGLPALKLGDSRNVQAGQWAVAIGSPFGLDNSVTAGIVSAIGRSNRNQTYVPFIQTDVAVNRGNSGGPLLNTRGEVIGINSQIFSNSGGFEGVSFAIPIDTAMAAVKQLKATGKVRYGMLGVVMQPVGPTDAKALGLPDSRGALINQVQPGSAAEKAGLQQMDVIRAFNGERVRDQTELAPRVGLQAPGTRAMVTVWRDGREREIPVVLGALDDRNAVASNGSGRVAPVVPAAAGNRLGLQLENLDARDRQELGLRPGEGVGIADVRGDAARDAGLGRGDVILALGRTRVGSVAALQAELGKLKKGDSAMLLVRNEAGQAFVTVPVDR
ncbi:Do family serine endopeptidase [Solilutibacter silvestris]|uniref:Probable periplasmic serine endoprotease DegP-like n=1 Tax=Solilutibacter silvestris TaxID=1645665 RepID=A0A2K1PZN1_9GAMM|nr:Do family serine endopeptidase [Lysobacter silvestris]PNS08254.1 peptidase Do [Lysobacter silvestris]